MSPEPCGSEIRLCACQHGEAEECSACALREAAGASLARDVATLYLRSPRFAEAFDRCVIDYLPLRLRITTPPLLRVLGRLNRDRNVPWPPMRLIKEVARRSGRVQAAKAKANA